MGDPPKKHINLKTSLVAAVLLMTVSACGGAAGGSAATGAGGTNTGRQEHLTTVTVGQLPANAAAGFIRMGEAKDFFKNYGVKVSAKVVPNATELTPSLIAGAVDIIEESPGAAMTAIQKGELKAKIIGSDMPGLPWMIVAKPSIKTLAELKGHSMGVSSSTGAPRVIAELILEKHGINPSSIKFVNTAANAQRFEEVIEGAVDSASVPSDFLPQAKKAGLSVLALSAHEIPLYPRFTFIARTSFLDAHPKAAIGFLAGVIQGERYAFDHPQQAKELAAKALGGKTTASSPSVVDMYNQIVKDKLVNRNGSIPMSMLQYLQKVLLKVGLLQKPLNLSTLYDDQYRQKAVALVNKIYPS